MPLDFYLTTSKFRTIESGILVKLVRQHDNLVKKIQVGVRTMQPQPHTNIELPNDSYSDYHLVG